MGNIYINSDISNTISDFSGNELGTSENPLDIELPLGYIDTFNRIRVSEPYTRFEYSFLYDELPLVFTSLVANSGTVTYDSNKKATILTATTATNSEATYQSRQYIKYYPGKSNLIVFTGNFKSKVANVIKRYGQFDASNGYFFELNGTTANVVLRTKISGTVEDRQFNQSEWNIDTMDGNGISGVNIDWSKQQIFVINYQWLGSGKIFYGFDVDGKIYWAHSISNSNVLNVLYSQTAQLPIRASIKNTVSTSSTMEMTCGVVISEGGVADVGRLNTINNATTARTQTTAGTKTPVISLRKKSANLATEIQVKNIFGLFSSSDEFFIEIIKNGTLTSASFSDVSGHCQKDVSATAISGGTVIYSCYVRGATNFDLLSGFNDISNIFIGQLLDGTSEILTIAATNITANTSMYMSINYKEIF